MRIAIMRQNAARPLLDDSTELLQDCFGTVRLADVDVSRARHA